MLIEGRSTGRRRWIRGVVCLSVLLTLAGCGSHDSTTNQPTSGNVTTRTLVTSKPVPTSTAPSTPANALIEVVWTTEVDAATGAPQDAVDAYAIDAPEIIAAVRLGTVPRSSDLTATWTIDGEPMPGMDMAVTSGAYLDSGWAVFSFSRNPGRLFPPGTLEITVTSSTGETITGSVEIAVAP